MKLSVLADRNEDEGVRVIHAGLDSGVNLLDTADAYCLDETDVGHNERLVARALEEWDGDSDDIRVATKGGIVRTGGSWDPDGRAKHLRAACEASLVALGVDRIDLYQFHVPDPKVPFATSVRALRDLKRSGMIAAVGLSNVTVTQIREAQEIVDIDAVQISLSPFTEGNFRNGVVEHCVAEGIEVLAYSPFGGMRSTKVGSSKLLREIGERNGGTAHQVVLDWLYSLHPLVVPIPGAGRIETARQAGVRLGLPKNDMDLLDLEFPTSIFMRESRENRRPDPGKGDVVLVMGSPGGGKTSHARELVTEGYRRLNRDDVGGTLKGLMPLLEEALDSGEELFVLDNTYPTRTSRNHVVEMAWRYGVKARVIWITTTLEQAQVNTVRRMIEDHGHLLTPEEMAASKSTTAIPPEALFRYQRRLEPPIIEEGFDSIVEVPFEMNWPDRDGRAVIMEIEGVLEVDGEIPISRREVLEKCAADGFQLFAITWAPGADDIDGKSHRINDHLGIEIEYSYCPHIAGPPVCWCRKPLQGLVVSLLENHQLDPAQCIFVGTTSADRGLAARTGIPFQTPDEFF